MKTFAQLGTVHRNEPCAEYPGTWITYEAGEVPLEFSTLEAALTNARYRAAAIDCRGSVSVNWAASNDDPRVGQTWFTGFYRHTLIDQHGREVDSPWSTRPVSGR